MLGIWLEQGGKARPGAMHKTGGEWHATYMFAQGLVQDCGTPVLKTSYFLKTLPTRPIPSL